MMWRKIVNIPTCIGLLNVIILLFRHTASKFSCKYVEWLNVGLLMSFCNPLLHETISIFHYLRGNSIYGIIKCLNKIKYYRIVHNFIKNLFETRFSPTSLFL